MSSVISGDKPRSKSVVSTASGTTNVTAGAPVTNLGANIKNKKTITDRVPAYTTPKNVPRTYVSAAPKTFKTIFGGRGVVPLAAVNRFPTRFAPKATVVAKPVVKPTAKKPATVVSNVTNEKPSPTKAAPARMSVNARTGNTTGFTTGKTTGTSVSKPGVAGKTYQSAGDRMKANAMNRGNQPAGPIGGGGGRMGGGTGPSRSGGGGNLGGARGRISEPGGSKR
jgi:hypothetical protein